MSSEELRWTRNDDGSYSSKAGTIKRVGKAGWEAKPLFNIPMPLWCDRLADYKKEFQRAWEKHQRKAGPIPPLTEILDEFRSFIEHGAVINHVIGNGAKYRVIIAMIEVCKSVPATLTAPLLKAALEEWWRISA